MTYSSLHLDTVFQRCSKNAMGIPSDLNMAPGLSTGHFVLRAAMPWFSTPALLQLPGTRHCSPTSHIVQHEMYHLVQQLPIPGPLRWSVR